MGTTGFAVLTLLGAGFASAQAGPGASARLTHAPLACMGTGEFPLVEAVYEATDPSALRSARVFFKAARSDVWYYVDMASAEGSRFEAVLPKPLPETEGVDYYLYFLESSLETAQSEEYTAQVSESGCEGMRAGMASPAGILLGATVPNQAAVPLGFSPQGLGGLVSIAGESVGVGTATTAGGAGGGGLSGATVGVIAGGAAAAGVGVAVATGGGDGDGSTGSGSAGQGGAATPTPSPTPAPTPAPAATPTPMPSPTPSPADLSGVWRIVDLITESCESSFIGQSSVHTLQIQQEGTRLDARISGADVDGPLQGSSDSAGNFTLRGRVVDEGDLADVVIEGISSGSQMSGSFTEVFVEFTCTIRGTFTGSRP